MSSAASPVRGRLFVIAAVQEEIEHLGKIEYGLYRKIKDRYPLRLLLSHQ